MTEKRNSTFQLAITFQNLNKESWDLLIEWIKGRKTKLEFCSVSQSAVCTDTKPEESNNHVDDLRYLHLHASGKCEIQEFLVELFTSFDKIFPNKIKSRMLSVQLPLKNHHLDVNSYEFDQVNVDTDLDRRLVNLQSENALKLAQATVNFPQQLQTNVSIIPKVEAAKTVQNQETFDHPINSLSNLQSIELSSQEIHSGIPLTQIPHEPSSPVNFIAKFPNLLTTGVSPNLSFLKADTTPIDLSINFEHLRGINPLQGLVALNQQNTNINMNPLLIPQNNFLMQQLNNLATTQLMTTSNPFLQQNAGLISLSANDLTVASLAQLAALGLTIDVLQSIPITPMPNPSILSCDLKSLVRISPSQIIQSHLDGRFYSNDSQNTMISRVVTISNDLVGCIIGKNGCTINAIRKLSTAQIKIANLENGSKDRKITITGQSDGVAKSIALIQHILATHQQVWRYNLQLATSMTYAMTSGDETSRSAALAHAARMSQTNEMSAASVLQRMTHSPAPNQMQFPNTSVAPILSGLAHSSPNEIILNNLTNSYQSSLLTSKMISDTVKNMPTSLSQILLPSNADNLNFKIKTPHAHRSVQQKFQPY